MPAGTALRRAAWLGTAFAVVWFWLVATEFEPWGLFERGPFTADFYEVQARALSRGRLAVPAEVVGIEGYRVDGESHLYYGLVPALARLPIAAFTDAVDGRMVVVSQLGAIAVAGLASARLLWRSAAAQALEPAPWVVGVFAFAVGGASPLLWLGSRPLIYHEAELWGATLALVGFERVLAWWANRTGRDLVLAGAASALAVSTRASIGLGPVLALGLLALVLATRRSWKTAVLVLITALVPVVLYSAVNLNRFGTLWSIPFEAQAFNPFSAQRRAALADNGGTLFGLKFLPTTALQYLRPDTLRPQLLLPWLTWGPSARVVGGVTFDTIDRAASLPVAAPWLLGLSVPGVWAMVRRRVPVAWAACLLGGVLAAVPTLTIAFVANRYLADFVPPLVVASAVGVPVVAGWLRTRSVPWRRAGVGLAVGLVGVAFVVNGALAVLAQRLYLLPDAVDQRAFIGLQYDVYDRIPGGPPPHLNRFRSLGPPGRDGQLAVVGDCDGLYRSDGAGWRAVELRPGGDFRARLDGRLAAGTVASGDGWTVELVTADGSESEQLQAVYRADDGTMISGEPFTPPAEPAPDAAVLDLVADPAMPIVRVTLEGDEDRELVSAFLVPAGGPIIRGEGWVSRPGSAPLCERLVARDQRGESTTMN